MRNLIEKIKKYYFLNRSNFMFGFGVYYVPILMIAIQFVAAVFAHETWVEVGATLAISLGTYLTAYTVLITFFTLFSKFKVKKIKQRLDKVLKCNHQYLYGLCYESMGLPREIQHYYGHHPLKSEDYEFFSKIIKEDLTLKILYDHIKAKEEIESDENGGTNNEFGATIHAATLQRNFQKVINLAKIKMPKMLGVSMAHYMVYWYLQGEKPNSSERKLFRKEIKSVLKSDMKYDEIDANMFIFIATLVKPRFVPAQFYHFVLRNRVILKRNKALDKRLYKDRQEKLKNKYEGGLII